MKMGEIAFHSTILQEKYKTPIGEICDAFRHEF